MHNNDSTDDMLFTPLTARDASVSLAELQQYVVSHPVPNRPVRTYVVAAMLIVCIGLGTMLMLRGGTDEVTIVEQQHEAKAIAPQVSTAPDATVHPASEPLPIAKPGRKQVASNPRAVPETRKPVLADAGLTEKLLIPDPAVELSQQFALECTEPSLLVALARIEFSDSQEMRVD